MRDSRDSQPRPSTSINPLNISIMFTHTTIAQEITLQAYAFGVFDILFNELDMGRDVVFNIFEDWATEFEQEEEKHRDDPDWFFFDEIDKLILRKKAELEKPEEADKAFFNSDAWQECDDYISPEDWELECESNEAESLYFNS